MAAAFRPTEERVCDWALCRNEHHHFVGGVRLSAELRLTVRM